MGAGQISGAHQELADDLAAREPERRGEEEPPFLLRKRLVGVEPTRERSMGLPKEKDPPGVLDDRFDLRPVADDARVGEQPAFLPRAVSRDPFGSEAFEGRAKGLAFLQDREPGEPRLVDLEREPLEEGRVAPDRESVLPIVVLAVERLSRREVAIAGGDRSILRTTSTCLPDPPARRPQPRRAG